MDNIPAPELFVKACDKGDALYEKLSEVCKKEIDKALDEAASTIEINSVVPYMLIKAMSEIAAHSISFATDIVSKTKEDRAKKVADLSGMFLKLYNRNLENTLNLVKFKPTAQEEIQAEVTGIINKGFPVGGTNDVN